MKLQKSIILGLVLCMFLPACSIEKPVNLLARETIEYSDRSIPIGEIPETFTAEDAITSNYMVIESPVSNFEEQVVTNEDVFLEFYDTCMSGQPASIRIMHIYHGNDPVYTGYTLYEEEREKYPVFVVYDVVFDGKEYTCCYGSAIPEYNDRNEPETYKYLLYSDEEMPYDKTHVGQHEEYFLCDEKVEFSDIMDSMLSSSSNAPHYHNTSLYGIYTYNPPLQEMQKEQEAPYQIDAAEAADTSTVELMELALRDPFVIRNYFPYKDQDNLSSLVDDAIAEHPYLAEFLSRDGIEEEMANRDVFRMEGYTDWDEVLEQLYVDYINR